MSPETENAFWLPGGLQERSVRTISWPLSQALELDPSQYDAVVWQETVRSTPSTPAFRDSPDDGLATRALAFYVGGGVWMRHQHTTTWMNLETVEVSWAEA
jgi:hypothetical protein